MFYIFTYKLYINRIKRVNDNKSHQNDVHPTRKFSPGTALSHKYLTAAKKSMQRTWIELPSQIFYTSIQAITPTCKNVHSMTASFDSFLKFSTSRLNRSLLLLPKTSCSKLKRKNCSRTDLFFLACLISRNRPFKLYTTTGILMK